MFQAYLRRIYGVFTAYLGFGISLCRSWHMPRLDDPLETDPPGTVSLSGVRAEDPDLLRHVEAPSGSPPPLGRPLSLRSSCRGLEAPTPGGRVPEEAMA